MKKCRKIVIYELHSNSYVISPTKIGKSGRFAQKPEGQTCNVKIEHKELGRLVKKWMDKSEWSSS